jgi:hypothetical protein
MHYPTRPVDKDKAEHELVINIKKATSPEETAPKQKHVRSMSWRPPGSYIPSNHDLQSVSSTHGTTIPRSRFGVASAFNPSLPMKFRPSNP